MEPSTFEKYEIVIIDPASTEFNRGSFCYLPYLLYLGLESKGTSVKLIENFTVQDMDNLPEADQYLVACWSYPQIDACFVLNRFLDPAPDFFGYTPMLKNFNLPYIEIADELILSGMKNYPDKYSHFKYLLLSDCDMHLKQYEGQVYPLFTSYGCPKGCAFCPSTVNCNKTRISLSLSDVKTMIFKCAYTGVHNIHFTDEDFFYDIDRAYEILKYIESLSATFQLISLGDVGNVLRFINKYGNNILHDAGMKLIEVGLETADPTLGKSMGKITVDKCKKLAELCEVNLFWLALTFFPGETIQTLNETGKFLKEYGWKIDDLYGRIATNSTEGGLGQFFQPYHGTKGYDNLRTKGWFISHRPIRLIPSFVPNSFVDLRVKQKAERNDLDKWFGLYGLNPMRIREDASIWRITEENHTFDGISYADTLISYAIYARLGVI